MMGRTDVERVLDTFLAPEHDDLPDRVLEAALGEIARSPQRRDRVAPWRFPPMLKLPAAASSAIVAVVAVVALGGALVLLGSRPGSGGPTAVPTTGPTTQARSSMPSTSLTAIPHGPIVGTFTTTLFAPAVTFTVESGWINQRELPEYFRAWMGDDRHVLTIGRVDGDPLVYARPNSSFTIGAPRPTTVGGLPAQEVSLLLSPTATSTDGFALAPFARAGSTIDLLPLRVMYAGSTCRVITVQVRGQQVVIVAERPTLDTTNFDQQVEAILGSISFN